MGQTADPVREQLVHRPLLMLAAGLVLGIAATWSLFACLLVIALVLGVRHIRSGLIASVGFAVGALIAPPEVVLLHRQDWIDGEATVVSVPRPRSDSTVCEIEASGRRLTMVTGKDVSLSLRDRIHIRAVAKPLSEGSEWLAQRGVVGNIRPAAVEVVHPGPWLFRIGDAWRDSFCQFCERWLTPEAAAATEAVCFNVDSALDRDAKDKLARSGTVHIVSASGLHVGVLAVAALWILSRLPVPRAWQLVAVMALLCLYAIASGLHPPVIRATLMAAVLLGAYLVRREPDLLSALAFAAIVQLLWDPGQIRNPGFQLSFTVVAAFALFRSHQTSQEVRGLARFKQGFTANLRQTAVATAASAPLVAYSFGTFSLTSLLANLLLAFTLPVLVVAAMAAHLIGFIAAPPAVGTMVAIVGPLSGWMFYVTDTLGGDWAAVSVPSLSGYWVLLAYALMICVWRVSLRPA